ncbi:MAG: thiosulfate oxidation carrier complex protein SoxZ [Acetobacteraceae bacterium]
MVRVLVNVPKRVRAGEPFEVKLLISHPMESGQRRDATGGAIPRDIIRDLECTMAGETVLHLSLFPAIAANPFLAFSAVARTGGDLVIRFTDDHGTTQTETVAIAVE